MSPRVASSHRRSPQAFSVGILAVLLAASSVAAQRPDPPLGLTLVAQRQTGIELTYRMPSLHLTAERIGELERTRVGLPGIFLPGTAGAPDLPSLSRWVAIPRGAEVRLEVVLGTAEHHTGLAVAAARAIPREDEPLPAYLEDPAIYGRDALYPVQPVVFSAVQRMRGVDVVQVGITPFQYNPVTGELIAYTEIYVRVHFDGGGTFGENRLRSRFWEPLLRQHLINYASLPPFEPYRPRAREEGCEYAILVPDDPDFLAWADTLKTWRTLQGISTRVFTTTEIGGSDTLTIKNWLHSAYNTWGIPPAAFLLLGDYPETGFRQVGLPSPVYDYYCISDNLYADVDGDDLPDMVAARIAARGAEELQAMIGKMLAYERTPPQDPAFYAHPLITGGWEADRWFILCAEICLGFQQEVLGREPVREYVLGLNQMPPRNVWSTAENTQMVVDYFGPDGLGYIPATPLHLTDWSGDADGINAAINGGAYMVVHRNHGVVAGWDEPPYYVADMAGLTNDLHPFVFSMNCLTGKYDAAAECFAEAFHRRHEGSLPDELAYRGALGIIAATKESYSYVNDALTWGVMDALWAEFDPAYGGAARLIGSPQMWPAFALASGKYYLAASGFPNNPGQKAVTYHLFHHHGDAFLQMYSEVPSALTVVHADVCNGGLASFTVQADAGAWIGLTVNGELVGAAEATGAPLDVPLDGPLLGGELCITVTMANHLRYAARVPIVTDPQAGPDAASGMLPAVHFANPARGGVEFQLALPMAGATALTIYDVRGAKVASFVAERDGGGPAIVRWDTRDVPGGLYFLRIEAQGRRRTERLVVVR
jgi:hypothetical protein